MTYMSREAQFKRKFPRRQFARAVGFLFNGDYFLGQGVEIGEGGIAIQIKSEFPVGKEAVVSFQLPDASFVCLRVEIRSSQADPQTGLVTVGLLFKNLKFEQKREIRTYVSARTDLEH